MDEVVCYYLLFLQYRFSFASVMQMTEFIMQTLLIGTKYLVQSYFSDMYGIANVFMLTCVNVLTISDSDGQV